MAAPSAGVVAQDHVPLAKVGAQVLDLQGQKGKWGVGGKPP